ncbi:esterase YqiA [Catenovulum sp. SM1970]|uniref:YqiA/YcfP family alpha/beta fold hydrolase n=1 Tax=Marinifaba aquimaris TaxID=2741323 RepID=UPI001574680C|nr:YqiA/YcfP family alpha/beta fold hydrolase [Marinifaba aquimaris]NTS77697.1 esterase YqiA [Marinifaba aquimaris]
MAVTKHILYLHGFLSSPQSLKAQQTLDYITRHHPDIELIIPQLPNCPDEVKKTLDKILNRYQGSLIGFIGSSLGGYLSTWCASKTQLPAVLVNPAAYPYILLRDYMGWHTHPYTDEKFEVTDTFNQGLVELDIPKPGELPLWLLLQTGDETLDYKEAETKFEGCKMTIEQGGDHAFQNYQNHLPQIIEYLLRSH